jgi:hypothetical protein
MRSRVNERRLIEEGLKAFGEKRKPTWPGR